MMHQKEIIDVLRRGGVVAMPSDTIYGLFACAQDKEAVEYLYRTVKQRDDAKPCIVLLSDMKELEMFGVSINEHTKNICERFWPGAVTLILDASEHAYPHITRGGKTIACRLPHDEHLRAIIRETGPLIAPSCNPQGEPPARTIEEAQAYFGDTVDLYIDGGYREGLPSTIVDCTGERPRIVRQGGVQIV